MTDKDAFGMPGFIQCFSWQLGHNAMFQAVALMIFSWGEALYAAVRQPKGILRRFRVPFWLLAVERLTMSAISGFSCHFPDERYYILVRIVFADWAVALFTFAVLAIVFGFRTSQRLAATPRNATHKKHAMRSASKLRRTATLFAVLQFGGVVFVAVNFFLVNIQDNLRFWWFFFMSGYHAITVSGNLWFLVGAPEQSGYSRSNLTPRTGSQ
jgi:hypothetical protein